MQKLSIKQKNALDKAYNRLAATPSSVLWKKSRAKKIKAREWYRCAECRSTFNSPTIHTWNSALAALICKGPFIKVREVLPRKKGKK